MILKTDQRRPPATLSSWILTTSSPFAPAIRPMPRSTPFPVSLPERFYGCAQTFLDQQQPFQETFLAASGIFSHSCFSREYQLSAQGFRLRGRRGGQC